MAVGTVVSSEPVWRLDPITGVRVTRITDPAVVCHLASPGMRGTSADGTVLLMVGAYGQSRQLYAHNLDTGRAVQLTAGRGLNEYDGILLDVDDRHALYAQGPEIWRIDLVTLLREHLFHSRPPWTIHSFSQSSCGRFLAITEFEEGSLPADVNQQDWSLFSLSAIGAPHCRIVWLDLAVGKGGVVVDEESWIGHTSISPGEPRTILYAHEGPPELIDTRLWAVSPDGSERRPVRPQGAGEVVVGQYWLSGGAEVGFLRYERDGSAAEIRACDVASGEERVLARCHPFAHIAASADGRWIVGDTSASLAPLHQQKTGGRRPRGGAENTGSIYLVDTRAGRDVRLCDHLTSWIDRYGSVQDTHPHPQVSANGRSVLFVSDADGRPAIYRVDLARFLWEHAGECGPAEPGDEALVDVSWGFPATYR